MRAGRNGRRGAGRVYSCGGVRALHGSEAEGMERARRSDGGSGRHIEESGGTDCGTVMTSRGVLPVNHNRLNRWAERICKAKDGSVSILLVFIVAAMFLFTSVFIDYARIAAAEWRIEALARQASARSCPLMSRRCRRDTNYSHTEPPIRRRSWIM